MSYTHSNGATPTTANGSSNGAKSHLVYGLPPPIESASTGLDDHYHLHQHHNHNHNHNHHHHLHQHPPHLHHSIPHQEGHHGVGTGASTSTSASMHDPPSENGYVRSHYASPSSHNEEIIEHLYQSGFQMGNYADTVLNVNGRQYRLHAILLSRSPYLAHLMSAFPPGSPIRNIYIPIEEEPEVTQEGFAIALGYLYSSRSLEMLTPSNARAVLAAACFLGGLPDLCAYAYETCRDSISIETIQEWLRFIETVPPPPEETGNNNNNNNNNSSSNSNSNSNSNNTTGPTTDINRHQPIPTSLFGPYAAQLRADILHFLISTLPHALQAFTAAQPPSSPSLSSSSSVTATVTPFGSADSQQTHALNGKSSTSASSPSSSSQSANGLQTLLQIYSHVPFEMFKQAVESPELPIGSDQARFQFAKAAIARRKASVGHGVEETVVLAFGGSTNSGSAVHVTRKVKRRPLWKVTK